MVPSAAGEFIAFANEWNKFEEYNIPLNENWFKRKSKLKCHHRLRAFYWDVYKIFPCQN